MHQHEVHSHDAHALLQDELFRFIESLEHEVAERAPEGVENLHLLVTSEHLEVRRVQERLERSHHRSRGHDSMALLHRGEANAPIPHRALIAQVLDDLLSQNRPVLSLLHQRSQNLRIMLCPLPQDLECKGAERKGLVREPGALPFLP